MHTVQTVKIRPQLMELSCDHTNTQLEKHNFLGGGNE